MTYIFDNTSRPIKMVEYSSTLSSLNDQYNNQQLVNALINSLPMCEQFANSIIIDNRIKNDLKLYPDNVYLCWNGSEWVNLY